MAAADSAGPLNVAVDILVGGQSLLKNPPGLIVAIDVQDDLGLPGTFGIDLVEASGAEGKSTWLDDDTQFALGAEIEIRLGYNGAARSVFKGEITALEPSFDAHGPAQLSVRGYDKRHRLQRGSRTRSFQHRRDSEVVEEIARDFSIDVKATRSAIEHDYLVQANQSDLEFLQSRAEAIDYELLMIDGKLVFRPSAFDAGAGLTLEMGVDIEELSLSCSIAAQTATVAVQAWSAKDKDVLVGRAAAGDEKSRMGGKSSAAAQSDKAFGSAEGVVVTRPAANQAEVDARARARFNQAGLQLISAEGRCLGRADLRAGNVVEIKGAGKRYSGQYYLHSVVHHYEPDTGFETRFQARRNAL